MGKRPKWQITCKITSVLQCMHASMQKCTSLPLWHQAALLPSCHGKQRLLFGLFGLIVYCFGDFNQQTELCITLSQGATIIGSGAPRLLCSQLPHIDAATCIPQF
jgi:hypothetical protein